MNTGSYSLKYHLRSVLTLWGSIVYATCLVIKLASWFHYHVDYGNDLVGHAIRIVLKSHPNFFESIGRNGLKGYQGYWMEKPSLAHSLAMTCSQTLSFHASRRCCVYDVIGSHFVYEIYSPYTAIFLTLSVSIEIKDSKNKSINYQ
jgi:hypothetical protein